MKKKILFLVTLALVLDRVGRAEAVTKSLNENLSISENGATHKQLASSYDSPQTHLVVDENRDWQDYVLSSRYQQVVDTQTNQTLGYVVASDRSSGAVLDVLDDRFNLVARGWIGSQENRDHVSVYTASIHKVAQLEAEPSETGELFADLKPVVQQNGRVKLHFELIGDPSEVPELSAKALQILAQVSSGRLFLPQSSFFFIFFKAVAA